MSPASTPIRALADRVWDYRLEREAYLQLKTGRPVTVIRADTLSDRAEDAAFARTILGELDAIDPSGLSLDDELTAGFLRHTLTSWQAAVEHYWFGFSCAPYSSFFLTFAVQNVFAGFRFGHAADVDRYLSLLADLRNVIGEMASRLRGQRDRGILVPQPAIPGVRETLTRQRDGARALLAVADERLTDVAAADAARLRTGIEQLVDVELPGAFDDLLGILDDAYVATAPAEVGWAQYDGGAEFYRAAIRMHTTTDYTAEQVHAIGLEQVALLSDEMAKVRADIGFEGTEAEFHAQLAVDTKRFARDASEIEAKFQRHMTELEPKISGWFSTLPKAPYGVARLAPQLEAGMTYGYYQPPTPVEPVGRYMYNGSELDKRSTLTHAALIFHELAPGHHFHLARQSENTELPTLRREAIDIGAFNEGWAEYAAGLGWEMGLYEDPYDRYGRLVHERFTAQRLVIDTGMNALGWSLERAREYMAANTTESDIQIASETLRYSTDIPAQALAYRLGYVEFMRLRALAEKELGDRFDVRDFHEVVLGPGALPFPVIEGHVRRWIRETNG